MTHGRWSRHMKGHESITRTCYWTEFFKKLFVYRLRQIFADISEPQVGTRSLDVFRFAERFPQQSDFVRFTLVSTGHSAISRQISLSLFRVKSPAPAHQCPFTPKSYSKSSKKSNVFWLGDNNRYANSFFFPTFPAAIAVILSVVSVTACSWRSW